MKNTYLVVLALTFLTCQDFEQQTLPTRPHLSRKVGSEITSAEAHRWTNRFRKQLQSREMSDDFIITRELLQTLIAIDCDGLFFYHGIDGEEQHLICVPVKDDHVLWASIILDITVSNQIPPVVGTQLFENYKSKNPNSIWGYFFGRNVFDEILANPLTEHINLVSAVNDDNVEVLVIYSMNEKVDSGRSTGEGGAYNHSFLCPSNCPQ